MDQPPPALIRRIAVTVLAPIAVVLIARLPLPGLQLEALAKLGSLDRSMYGLFAFGLVPFVDAAVVVEIAALVRPRWRPLRYGAHHGRSLLEAWSLLVAVVFAGLQAFFYHRWMVRSGEMSPFFDVLPTSAAARVLVGVAPALGSLLLVGIARAIGRYGLGNGFSILIAALAMPDLADGVMQSLQRVEVAGSRVFAPLALALMVVVALTSTTAARPRRGWLERPLRPSLLTPASGLAPFVVMTGLLALPAQIATFAGRSASPLSPGSLLDSAIRYPLLAAMCALFAWLFNRPRLVARVWARVPGVGDEPQALAKAALRRAFWRSLPFLAALAVVGTLAVVGRLALNVMMLTVIACVAVDVGSELRFRRLHGALAPAWPVHRLYAVGPALAALSNASVPAFPRALRHATLLSFFGPYVPVEILVPATRLDEAQSLLAPLLLETGPSADPVRP
jgi:preprotein translocase subunit SecY